MLLENVDIGRRPNKYVCSLDVGTTTIRAFIYDENGHVKGRDLDRVCPK
jgi:glycerol kinase